MKPWKIQKFFGDLVYDLRSRGLLPLAVLLLAGMIAVPVVLAGSGGSSSPPVPAAQKSAAELAPENQRAVVAYNPGVRDYKERLSELEAKDPFKQQYATSPAAETALDQTGVGDVSTSPTEGSGGASDGGEGEIETGGNGAGGAKKKTVKGKIVWLYHEVDVEVGEVGLTEEVEDVESFSFLPSEDAPVLVFTGVRGDGKRAMFLVAKDVSGVTGSGTCLPSPESCQTLTLGRGDTQEMFYAVTGKTYSVKVKSIRRVISRKPPD
jgi:hypothetical protein